MQLNILELRALRVYRIVAVCYIFIFYGLTILKNSLKVKNFPL